MNGIDDLAAAIAGLRVDAAGAEILAKLRLHVVDTVGAWIATTRTAEGQALLAFWRSSGRTLHDDLATHCALARLSEVDDIHLASMTTPGSVVIPAAMTLASNLPNPDPGDVAAAMLAGYEAMIGLGLAIKGPQVLYRGIWPTYFAAGFGTAAVAARLWRLDARQTAHALALALTWASPSVGQHHAPTTGRWLSVGHAARNGLHAAQAAQAGFTADTNVLQSPLLPDVYGIKPELAAMSTTPAFAQVSLKPWCAARQTMAATQALRELLDGGLRAADITEIAAAVLPPHLKMTDHGVKPGDRASFITSLPYQLAVAALQPERALVLNPSAAALPPALASFMAKVKVSADESLLTDYPAAWPACVTVKTGSSTHEKSVHDVPGDPARPFNEADVLGKFRRLVAPVLGGEGCEGVLAPGQSVLQSAQSLAALMREIEAACGA